MVSVDDLQGAWYTSGVGLTTTADTHHHSTAEERLRIALGRSVSGAWGVLRRFFRAVRERVLGVRPLDAVWCWRQVYRAAPRDAARVRFVLRAQRGRLYGVAYLDEGHAEVDARVVGSAGEAVLTALHEIVHLRQDRARHDRAFLADLRSLVGRLVPAPAASPGRVRRAEIDAFEAVVIEQINAGRGPARRRAVRWRRRGRSV